MPKYIAALQSRQGVGQHSNVIQHSEERERKKYINRNAQKTTKERDRKIERKKEREIGRKRERKTLPGVHKNEENRRKERLCEGEEY